MSGLLLNPLTADAMYSRHITGNLLQPVQMQLSQNQKLFF